MFWRLITWHRLRLYKKALRTSSHSAINNTLHTLLTPSLSGESLTAASLLFFLFDFPSFSSHPNMHSATLKTHPLPSFSSLTGFSRFRNPNFSSIQYSKHKKEKRRESISKSIKCICFSDSNINSYYFHPLKSSNPSSSISRVADKVQSLVSEFESLSEPIDRVKRLLHYADLLPPLDESARIQSNRVTGCTVQVWLEASMVANGTMRFRADSDSEIAKGFCSCLVWMMDGASPEEVLEVKMEDLAELNMGLSGRAHSRVNTWHNVLIGMQRRTKALVEEREGKVYSLSS